jgi:hypothetical protein
MKQFVFAGTLAGALALAGTALAQTPAQQPPPAAPKPAATGQKPATPATGQADAPAAPKPRPARRVTSGQADPAGHTAPKAQPTTAEAPNAQATALSLGNVRIPKGLKADGKELPAGTYQVRLTANEAKPDARGSSEVLERWVEFTQKGEVKGREVVSIVPNDEIKLVQKDAPPASNGAKVETLKGGDYVRVWINRGGNHYLIHLVN